MTTLALGTAEPDASFTTPEIPAEPPTDCANAHAENRSDIAVVAFQFMRDSSLSSYLKKPQLQPPIQGRPVSETRLAGRKSRQVLLARGYQQRVACTGVLSQAMRITCVDRVYSYKSVTACLGEMKLTAGRLEGVEKAMKAAGNH
jgi:hypothetical protein